MTVQPEGDSNLVITGRDGSGKIMLRASPESTQLFTTDGNTQGRVLLGALDNDEPTLSLTDAEGRVRTKMWLDKEGNPHFRMLDEEGNDL